MAGDFAEQANETPQPKHFTEVSVMDPHDVHVMDVSPGFAINEVLQVVQGTTVRPGIEEAISCIGFRV